MRLFFAFALGAVAYAAFERYVAHGRDAQISSRVRDRLPIAQDLNTVSDEDANYDIDGVSYDLEGVIVSSDASKPVASPI